MTTARCTAAALLVLSCQNLCKAQDANKLEMNILPALGFNLSMPALVPQSSKDNFSYTMGTAVPKDAFLGIGVQVQLLEDWQATLRFATTGYGYAWRYRYPLPAPFQKSFGNSQASRIINVLDFTTERKIASTGTMRLFKQNLKVNFQALLGIRYASVKRLDRVDTIEALPAASLINEIQIRDSIRNIRYGSGAISLGLNAQ